MPLPLGTVAPDSGEYELPAPGIYKAQIEKIEASSSISPFDGEERDQWTLFWRLLTYADGEAIDGADTIRQWCNQSLHPKSNMYSVVRGILGRELVENEAIDGDDLIGVPVQVVIEDYRKQNGKTGIRVGAIQPLRQRRAAAPKQPLGTVTTARGESRGEELFEDEADEPAPVAAGAGARAPRPAIPTGTRAPTRPGDTAPKKGFSF
jgi:hypothetical protein